MEGVVRGGKEMLITARKCSLLPENSQTWRHSAPTLFSLTLWTPVSFFPHKTSSCHCLMIYQVKYSGMCLISWEGAPTTVHIYRHKCTCAQVCIRHILIKGHTNMYTSYKRIFMYHIYTHTLTLKHLCYW